MQGNVGWQVREIYKTVEALGTSKHQEKIESRVAGARTWAELDLKVHSYNTYDSYRDIAKDLGQFIRTEYGCKDLTKIEPHMVQAFMVDKIENGGRNQAGVERSTANKYHAAMEKFEKALNTYSAVNSIGKTYDFQMDVTRKYASEKLGAVNKTSRAYSSPQAAVDAITGKHNLLASLIYETGARISEVSRIESKQLLGIEKDPYTGELRGAVSVQVKGGARLTIRPTIKTYERLVKAVAVGGNYRPAGMSAKAWRAVGRTGKTTGVTETSQTKFRQSLESACVKTGQTYHGPHGLRWNFVSEKLGELQKLGYSLESAMAICSKLVSHIRADITSHYTR